MQAKATLPAAVANLVKPRRWLSCAETAKLVRASLKEAFPEIKFSVRSSTYSMGASIRIGWTMGPTTEQVDAIVKRFAGSDFDGMTDSTIPRDSFLDGEPVGFGCNFVFTDRDIPAAKADALAEIFAKVSRARWAELIARFGFTLSEASRIADQYAPDPKEVACRFLQRLPAPEFDGRTSKTAASISAISRR